MLSKLFSRPKKLRRPAHPSTPAYHRLYAIGDIHGRFDLLEQMLHLIQEDAKSFKGERLIEIYLGDYIDRGWDSAKVIEQLCTTLPAGHERVCLRGNHEEVLLSYLKEPQVLEEWAQFGGLETLYSYGVHPPKGKVQDEKERLHQDFCEKFPEHHLHFMRQTSPSFLLGDYAFVHAGVRAHTPLESQVKDDLLWMREPFLSQDHGLPFCVVHGHTPSEEPEDHGYRIGIDTGAYITNILTCLVLEGKDKRYLVAQANQN